MVNDVSVWSGEKKCLLPKRLFGWLRLKNLEGRDMVAQLLHWGAEVCQFLVLAYLV
jgi:hypothetical protein